MSSGLIQAERRIRGVRIVRARLRCWDVSERLRRELWRLELHGLHRGTREVLRRELVVWEFSRG